MSDPGRSRLDAAVELLAEYKRVLALLVLGTLAYYGLTGASPPSPSPATVVIGLVVALSSVGAAVLARKLYALLNAEQWTYLVDIEIPQERFAIYRLNPEAMERLTVRDGSLHELPGTTYRAYECKRFNPEQLRCFGTWRGTASDLELAAEHERINEIRGELEDMARDGHKIRVKAPSVIRTAVADIVMEVVAIAESSRIPSGERISDAFESAVGEFDTEAELREVDPEQFNELPEGWHPPDTENGEDPEEEAEPVEVSAGD